MWSCVPDRSYTVTMFELSELVEPPLPTSTFGGVMTALAPVVVMSAPDV